jgi:hypothetical protein
MITIDEAKCDDVAATLRRINVPRAQEDDSLTSIAPNDRPNFYLCVVAICHQTSPIGGPQLGGDLDDGTHRVGWDYLRSRWAERVAANGDLVRPEIWKDLSVADLHAILTDARGVSTVSDCEGRAALLRELGQHLGRQCIEDATELLRHCQGRLRSNAAAAAGLYEALAVYRAYSDPVRKKSSFFLELMRNESAVICDSGR